MKNIKLFEEFSEKKKWKIYAGLAGGFGGANFIRTFTGTQEQAEKEAYYAAIEEYESYEGLHGLRTVDEIMEEDGLEYDEAMEVYNDERESWLDYYVKPDDGIKESIKIKDPNSLIVGKKYKIVWPVYDDYEEGLEPEVDVMEVIGKNKVDGYILKNVDHGWTINRHPNMLTDCEIDLLEEKAKTPGEKYKGKHIPKKYLTRKKDAMKKEIDEFRGKKSYKADWEADIDRRSGKRIKTKKSAATKAYQKMFGKKEK
jgi:hypothetical protein